MECKTGGSLGTVIVTSRNVKPKQVFALCPHSGIGNKCCAHGNRKCINKIKE